jgi:hypothetical protein
MIHKHLYDLVNKHQAQTHRLVVMPNGKMEIQAYSTELKHKCFQLANYQWLCRNLRVFHTLIKQIISIVKVVGLQEKRNWSLKHCFVLYLKRALLRGLSIH